MSLHRLINLCQLQAGRPIRPDAISTESDTRRQALHELCVRHPLPVLRALLSAKPLMSQAAHPTTAPMTQLLSTFLNAFLQIYQLYIQLTLKTYHLCVAEFLVLLLTLSAGTHLHHADGKKGKQFTSVCLARHQPVASRLPQLLLCSGYAC